MLVSTLQTEVLGIKTRLNERETQVDSLQEAIVNLAHENELLKRRLYGTKTERLQTSENQLALGNLLDDEKQLQKQLDEALAKAKAEAGQSNDPAPPPTPKAKPKGRRDLLSSDLPRILVDLRDPKLEQIGKLIGWDESPQLMYRRGGFSVLVKRTAKYEVAGKDGPTVLGVEVPETLFPRGLLHSSAVAYILVQKFGLGVPHYRLEQHILDQGVELDRGMMSRYVDEAGGSLGASIVHAMWQDAIQNAAIISTDATGALVQPEKRQDGQRQACKKGHFFVAVVDCDHVLFAYTERHTQEAVRQLFGDFKGFLQSDASSVYDILERGPPKDDDTDDTVKLVGCWAHCRRYFFEAAICKYQVGVQGLLRIRAIYAVDDSFRKLPPAKRKLARDEHVRPLIEAFFEWVKQARFAEHGRNLVTKALGYAANQEQELRRVLADGRLPLDNTRAERNLRKVVVGRKNWMFYGSNSHAESAAAIFSLVASCRLHGIDPQQYLDEVMRALPDWPKERYLELSPKYWRATRSNLLPADLDSPLCSFTVPPAALNFAR
ncbi:MAG TPA: IS66 family transposase [Polyangiaceae bacterium]|nr:IS66 family transposase [Polyangiaceae bacterium]